MSYSALWVVSFRLRSDSDKGMKITLDISEEDIERIGWSLDNQHAYMSGLQHRTLAHLKLIIVKKDLPE